MFRLKCYSLMLKAPLDADHRLNKIWQRTYGEKHDGWHIWTFHLQAGIKGEGRVFLKESGLTLGVPLSQGRDCIWRPAGSRCIFWYISLTLYSSCTRHCLTTGTGENIHYDQWFSCLLIFFDERRLLVSMKLIFVIFLVEWFIKDTEVRRTMLLKINRTTMSCKLKNVYMIVFLF